jgi:hypothetical protein
MLKAVIKYHFAALAVMSVIEVVLLMVVLKTARPYAAFSATTCVMGLLVTVTWAVFLFLIVRKIRPYTRDHLVVDFTQHRSIFSAVVACLAFLLTWSVLFIMAITVVPNSTRQTQGISEYFEHIRGDQPLLTAFLTQMPKGGDLHHHYVGAVYGETYWEILAGNNGWINMESIEVDTPGAIHQAPWKRFSEVQQQKWFDSLEQVFLQHVSVKDFNPALLPADQHFFATFGKLSSVAAFGMKQGLMELKKRAVNEHVQYIETILWQVDTTVTLPAGSGWDKALAAASLADSVAVFDTLNRLHAVLLAAGVARAARTFCNRVDNMHKTAQIDDSLFTMRYQLYGSRSASPVTLYRRLLIAFQAAAMDSIIVGVNLVSQEDGVVSMRDYSLHMLMFVHLRRLYPQVKYALHAGELNVAGVRPELLRSHIRQAVEVGRAYRIGHGVDLSHEDGWNSTIDTMAARKIPVEINLTSNEFILDIKNEQHPILLYHSHQVPVIIATDDAGVLRTDLTEQYVLLASRYPSLKYADIKQIVRNSIIYSFMKPAAYKRQQLRQLDEAINRFEKQILAGCHPRPGGNIINL